MTETPSLEEICEFAERCHMSNYGGCCEYSDDKENCKLKKIEYEALPLPQDGDYFE